MPNIIPKNTTAQLSYRAKGNPPSAQLESSVSNCFPGLEFDLRGMWAKIFEGIVLHETNNIVMSIESDAPDDLKGLENTLLRSVTHNELGDIPVVYEKRSRSLAVERGNALAELIYLYGGTDVTCRFQVPPVVKASSYYKRGNDEFPEELTLDLDPITSWLSDAQPTSGSIQFLEWDFEHEVNIESISINKGGGEVFRSLFPNKYTFKTKLKKNDKWVPIATQKNTGNSKGDNWFPISIERSTCRYVLMEMTELEEYSPGMFYASVGDVDFNTSEEIVKELKIRKYFPQPSNPEKLNERSLEIDEKELKSGELTQSLCSPWQHDYRDCYCVYWAASRPDIVNVDEQGRGHNWTDKERTMDPNGKPEYKTYNGSSIGLQYKDLFESWEKKDILKFQINGKDEE